jgi:hypothetical protein
MYKPLSPRFKKREKINDRGKTEGEGIAGKEEISRFQCNTNGPIQDVGMLPESQAAFTLHDTEMAQRRRLKARRLLLHLQPSLSTKKDRMDKNDFDSSYKEDRLLGLPRGYS